MSDEIYINAGGVELKIVGNTADSHAFAIWERLLTRVESSRNRIGSGTGFLAERSGDGVEVEGQQTLPELKAPRKWPGNLC